MISPAIEHLDQPEDMLALRAELKNNLKSRLLWLADELPGVKLIKTGPLIYLDSGRPFGSLNVVWGVPDTPEEVSELTRYYVFEASPACWWLPADINTPAAWWLSGEDWSIEDVLIGMALVRGGPAIDRLETAGDLEVRDCLDKTEIARLSAGWDDRTDDQHLAETTRSILDACRDNRPAMAGGQSGYKVLVGYVAGQPVVSMGYLLNGHHLGLYDLVVHPAYRGRRYMRTILRQVASKAFSDGCTLITLLAASRGVTACTALGFIPINQFVIWTNQATR